MRGCRSGPESPSGRVYRPPPVGWCGANPRCARRLRRLPAGHRRDPGRGGCDHRPRRPRLRRARTATPRPTASGTWGRSASRSPPSSRCSCAAEGRLDLHAPLTDVLPWFRVQTDHGAITPHHLLTHTAGLVQGPEIGSASNYDVVALAELPNGPLDAGFWYSNVGYRALGVAISHVAGRALPASWSPIGSSSRWACATRARRSPTTSAARWCSGTTPSTTIAHGGRSTGSCPAAWVESAEADGCISMSLEDFATYARMLLRRGEGVLDPDSFALMTTAYSHDHEDDEDYGYGLALTEHPLRARRRRDRHAHEAVGASRSRRLRVVTGVNGLDGSSALADAALAIARGDERRAVHARAARAPRRRRVGRARDWRDSAACTARTTRGRPASASPPARVGWCSAGTAATRSAIRWPRCPTAASGTARSGRPSGSAFDTEIDGRPQRAVMSGCPLYRRFSP